MISTLVNTIVSFRRLTTFFLASEVQEEEENKNWQDVDLDEDDEDGDEFAEDKVWREQLKIGGREGVNIFDSIISFGRLTTFFLVSELQEEILENKNWQEVQFRWGWWRNYWRSVWGGKWL